MREPKSILITGASSGIGAELARQYAAPGRTVMLNGRHAERLEAVATACAVTGATVHQAALDVTDAPAMARWIAEMDETARLDLVIANAGVSAGTGSGEESAAQARRIFAINLDGVVNTVQPALERMQQRSRPANGPRGQIAIMSSLASFRGFAGAPAYCASKAAVRIYGESLRNAMASEGIAVSVICPGFVRSPMTAVNSFTMPFLVDTEKAGRIIRRRLARNAGRIAFPWPMSAAIWLLAALPPAVTDRPMRRLPAKAGPPPDTETRAERNPASPP